MLGVLWGGNLHLAWLIVFSYFFCFLDKNRNAGRDLVVQFKGFQKVWWGEFGYANSPRLRARWSFFRRSIWWEWSMFLYPYRGRGFVFNQLRSLMFGLVLWVFFGFGIVAFCVPRSGGFLVRLWLGDMLVVWLGLLLIWGKHVPTWSWGLFCNSSIRCCARGSCASGR